MIDHKKCEQVAVWADDETYDSEKAIMKIEALTQEKSAKVIRSSVNGSVWIAIENTRSEIPFIPTLPQLLTICGLEINDYLLDAQAPATQFIL